MHFIYYILTHVRNIAHIYLNKRDNLMEIYFQKIVLWGDILHLNKN
jgi:hypothetical protein